MRAKFLLNWKQFIEKKEKSPEWICNLYKDEKIKIAEDVVTYIFQYYRDAIAIEDIANGLELSKSYISHVFNEMTGFSIMNDLMRYRLWASTKVLLAEQAKSIKEIAYEYGFESDAHFSRFFKKELRLNA